MNNPASDTRRDSRPPAQPDTPYSVWLTLVVSLICTAWLWRVTADGVETAAERDFQNHVDRTHEAVQQRLLAYEQILRGGIGLFAASERVSREEWQTYVASLKIDINFPGIQGIGYSERILPADLNRHIQEIRAEGFPDYSVKPAGERDEYTAIVYLEPFDFRNRRAFGYDMFSQPTRHAAMVRARDTGKTSVSGKVILKQETDEDVQAGFLMYLPLYAKGLPHKTLQQRREALVGYVYSPFRVNDLMRGILGAQNQDVDLEIYDGTKVSADTLMYDDDKVAHGLSVAARPHFIDTRPLLIQGHTWTLVVSSTSAFMNGIDRAKPRIVGLGGLAISLLFVGLVWVLATHRSRALNLANQMTATLREQGAFIRAVLDNAVDGVITVDEAGSITSVNLTAEQMFGYSSGEMLNNRIQMLVTESTRMTLDSYFSGYLKEGGGKGSGIGCEVSGLRRNGESFPMELSLSEVSQAGMRIFTVMIRDLSQRRQVERMKSEFVSCVSHELRTPLTSIRGSLGLLNGGVAGDMPEQAKSLIDIASKNTDRLLILINDILDIEKIQSGKMEFNLEPVELMPLVEQAIANIREYARQYAVNVKLISAVADARVNTDSSRLVQVLTNLLSNAAKFSSSGATVEVACTRENGAVRVAVTDFGVGIPEEFQGQIFEKFTQADSSDSRHKGGTGLGLSISRSIMDRLGGTIDFVSQPGKGSTFYITLPEAEPEAE